MQISEKGLKFIAGYEGLRLHLYNDLAGHCTIGFGHLVHHGPINGSEKQEYKDGITLARAFELLRKDAGYAEHAVNNQLVPLLITQDQFDALVSFVFNMGSDAFLKSSVCEAFNGGRLDLIPACLMKWVKANCEVQPGLVARRAAEAKAFQV